MGTWGTAVFADDSACAIRDQYRQDGVDDAEALRSTLDTFRGSFDDSTTDLPQLENADFEFGITQLHC